MDRRPGGFLTMAVLTANVWLAAIAIDALVALADDVIIHSASDSALFGWRMTIGTIVLALMVVVLLLVIFVPQLPKLVLLPTLAIELWLFSGAMPIAWSPVDRSTWIPLELIHFGAAALALVISKLTSGSWFIAASRLPARRASVLRTLIAIPVAFAALVVLALGVVVGGVVVYVQDRTKGYLQFSSTGIEVRESVMRKDDKVVHLVATVHFAEARFYRELYAAVPKNALILAEGVSDREGRLKKGLSYSNAAQALGLETQGVFEELLGPAQEPATQPGGSTPSVPSTAPQAATPRSAGASERPTVVRADIDVSEFSELTIRFISRVGEIYASATLSEALQKLSAVMSEFSEAEIALVMDDLVRRRNDKVLGELDKRLAEFDTVFIPWGALHMPGLEAGLKQRGFRIERQRMSVVARYETILGGLGGQASRTADARTRLPAAAARLARPRGVEPLLQD